jgi:hypothetical protein
MAVRGVDESYCGSWGQTLAIPTKGFLESTNGPALFENVIFVEIATCRINGGLRGLPLQFIDMQDEMVDYLSKYSFTWEVRKITWSRNGIFKNNPVKVFRFSRPFGFNSAPGR